jgi:hypothetical protein
VTYVIDAVAGIVTLTATGPTSTEDVFEVQSQLRRDPSFVETYHQLFDFRAATPTNTFSPQVEGLLANSPFAASSRRAYVVKPGVGYGMGRIAEALAEPRVKLKLFEDIASARKWLLERPAVDIAEIIEDERNRWP